ncbi:MAG: type IV pilus modification protein PilV [Chromatiales bacterium]|jgi:type IV pilus assembly protein PilV|nr:type IV pilus modification protein PilV [Chromatiales bacterium]
MQIRHQSGLSLIEVLITVVLVSIGLLGLAGLQLTSVQNSNSSNERFIATTLAQDILERMRANRNRAIGPGKVYNLAMGADPGVGGVEGADLNAWIDAIEAALPSGQGAVAVDDDSVATVTLEWTDASDKNADDSRAMSLTLSTTL